MTKRQKAPSYRPIWLNLFKAFKIMYRLQKKLKREKHSFEPQRLHVKTTPWLHQIV